MIWQAHILITFMRFGNNLATTDLERRAQPSKKLRSLLRSI